MKLTKNTLIEGQIFKKGTEVRIKERKQVGTSYHFTKLNNLAQILNSDMLLAPKYTETKIGDKVYPYISLTRDYNLIDTDSDFMPWGEVRLTLDGDRLSDTYKIIPFIDLDFLTTTSRSKGESERENAVLTKAITNLSNYTYQIDILRKAFSKLRNDYPELKKSLVQDKENPRKFVQKSTGLVFQSVDKFLPYKYQKV